MKTKKRNLLNAVTIFAILLAFSSCSSRQEDRGKREPKEYPGEASINPEVEALDNIADNAILVVVNKVMNDAILVTNKYSGSQYELNYSEADRQDKVIGTLSEGASFSILPDNAMQTVHIAINVDELGGKWIYDSEQQRGIVFETEGGLSSINTGDISFREWKLKNGKLYIYYVTVDMIAPKRNEYLVEEAKIKNLSAEHLVFEFQGTTYDCKRQRKAVQINMK